MYHYTYMIDVKNPTDERCRYIGVRSCSVKPDQDFYFGSCRPFKKWQAANGTDGLVKTVLAWWPNREQALKHEILLHDIFDVGRSKEFWNQAKQTASGFDTAGSVLSDQHKEKVKLALKGIKQTEEHKRKRSKFGEQHWNYGKNASDETRKKMSESHSGPNNAMYGKPVSDDRKRKIGESQKGEKSWRYGKKFPEMAEKLSKMFKGKPKEKTTCPHCGLFGAVNNLKRYHFDNCKAKE